MSLEQSMAELAKSNTALAEAQNRLADAQDKVADKYAEMIAFVAEKQGEAPAVSEDKPQDKPATRGRPKGSTAKPKVEDDGLGGDEEEAEERSEADVKTKLKELKEAGGDVKAIMGKFGAKAFPELKAADYGDCYDATVKAIAKL